MGETIFGAETRECNKCIHHTSGMCDSWDCKMQTVEDVKKEAVKEYVESAVAELEKLKGEYEHHCIHGAWQRGAIDGAIIALSKAISIVRGKE